MPALGKLCVLLDFPKQRLFWCYILHSFIFSPSVCILCLSHCNFLLGNEDKETEADSSVTLPVIINRLLMLESCVQRRYLKLPFKEKYVISSVV